MLNFRYLIIGGIDVLIWPHFSELLFQAIGYKEGFNTRTRISQQCLEKKREREGLGLGFKVRI
jgi:hypothetical protein